MPSDGQKKQIPWDKINAALPYKRNSEEKRKRIDMWKKFDPNGNGFVSLAECQNGVKGAIKVEDVYDATEVVAR